jgi:hypothetical protein
MTKKFINTDKAIHGAKVENEFLIPDIYNDTKSFIGLTSLNAYKFGRIVYTGVTHDTTEILALATSKKPIGFVKKRKARKIIERYLIELKELKISNHVTFNENGQLIKIDLKNQYFKSFWKEERTHNNENWGTSTWYFEIDHDGFPIKQLEIYANGKSLWYTRDKLDDKFGSLGDKAFEAEEFEPLLITKLEFDKTWSEKK